MTRPIGREAIRFLVAGASNTVLTLLLYQVLILVVSPRVAYGVTWLVGLGIVAIVYPSRVFGVASPTNATRIGVVLVYVASFLLGLAALPPAIGLLGKQLGVLPVLALTTVFNFAAMRIVIGRLRR